MLLTSQNGNKEGGKIQNIQNMGEILENFCKKQGGKRLKN